MANATVGGGLYGQLGNVLTQVRGLSSRRRTVARTMAHLKTLRELAVELNGVAAGAAALKTQKRIKADPTLDDRGGKQTIETETFVNRVTAAADQTAITDDLLTYDNHDATPPVNLDRNPLGTR